MQVSRRGFLKTLAGAVAAYAVESLLPPIEILGAPGAPVAVEGLLDAGVIALALEKVAPELPLLFERDDTVLERLRSHAPVRVSGRGFRVPTIQPQSHTSTKLSREAHAEAPGG